MVSYIAIYCLHTVIFHVLQLNSNININHCLLSRGVLFELTVASHQRMTVKKECRSQRGDPQMFILGDLTWVA